MIGLTCYWELNWVNLTHLNVVRLVQVGWADNLYLQLWKKLDYEKAQPNEAYFKVFWLVKVGWADESCLSERAELNHEKGAAQRGILESYLVGESLKRSCSLLASENDAELRKNLRLFWLSDCTAPAQRNTRIWTVPKWKFQCVIEDSRTCIQRRFSNHNVHTTNLCVETSSHAHEGVG